MILGVFAFFVMECIVCQADHTPLTYEGRLSSLHLLDTPCGAFSSMEPGFRVWHALPGHHSSDLRVTNMILEFPPRYKLSLLVSSPYDQRKALIRDVCPMTLNAIDLFLSSLT